MPWSLSDRGPRTWPSLCDQQLANVGGHFNHWVTRLTADPVVVLISSLMYVTANIYLEIPRQFKMTLTVSTNKVV